MLNEQIEIDILAHAASEYPRECCGFIAKGRYLPCRNVSDVGDQFRIDPRDQIAAEAFGNIDAIVHSHPDGTTRPSVPDLVAMNFHGRPWVITDGTNIAIHHPEGYVAPLLGREYYHGLMDCYTLVRDYYERELGITLGDYERSDRWWEQHDSAALYLENYEKEGFTAVGDIQKHDVILCRLGRTEHVNHALIFIGDGSLRSEDAVEVIGNSLILHHPHGRHSVRDIYGEQWQRRTTRVIRHKELL